MKVTLASFLVKCICENSPNTAAPEDNSVTTPNSSEATTSVTTPNSSGTTPSVTTPVSNQPTIPVTTPVSNQPTIPVTTPVSNEAAIPVTPAANEAAIGINKENDSFRNVSNVIDQFIELNFLRADKDENLMEARKIKILKTQIKLLLEKTPGSESILGYIYTNIIDNFKKFDLSDKIKASVEKKMKESIEELKDVTKSLGEIIEMTKLDPSKIKLREKGIREKIKNLVIYEADIKKLRDVILPHIFYLYAVSALSRADENIETQISIKIKYSLEFLSGLVQIVCDWESVFIEGAMREGWLFATFDEFNENSPVIDAGDDEDLSKCIEDDEGPIYSNIKSFIKHHKEKGKVSLEKALSYLVTSLCVLQKDIQTWDGETELVEAIQSKMNGDNPEEIHEFMKTGKTPDMGEKMEKIADLARDLENSSSPNAFEILSILPHLEKLTEILKDGSSPMKSIDSYRSTKNMLIYVGIFMLVANVGFIGWNVVSNKGIRF